MSEKNKAISLVGLILLIFSLAFLYQEITYSNKNLAQSISVAESSMNATILSIQDFSFSPYKSRIKNILQTNPEIAEAFAQKDRQLLYSLLLPRYNALKNENKYFYVMHLHLPDATTLLRMHAPEHYGDNLKDVRPIVDAVHQTKQILAGFEIGRHGPFYRIVSPVFYQDRYVGAIEFGIKAHEVLESLENKTSHLATSFFEKEQWKKFTKSPPEHSVTIEHYIVITHGDNLFSKLPSKLKPFIKDQQITIDGLEYILHFHPVYTDFLGTPIGGVLVLQNISQLIAEKNKFIIHAVLFTSLLLLLSFLILYFTFGTMLSKLVRAEKLASTAKAEWERTFDAVPDMISIIDDQHRIVRANKAMANNLDIPIQKLIHTNCYKTMHATEGPPDYCPHSKLLKDHKNHSVEIFDEHQQRYYTISVSPLTNDKGEFFGSVHITRDITDQKMKEEEKLKTEEKLQKAEKMEAIGILAGGVAHDLNNILSGVVSYPELLLLQLSPHDKLYKPIKDIHDSGKRAAAVVADLLTVARGVATVKKIVSPNTLIKEYLASPEFMKLKSLHSDVTIDLNLEEDAWNINCSPVHIQKAVMNLITNAIEAIDSHGTVHISTENQMSDFLSNIPSSLDSGEYMILRIQDSGSGIAQRDLEHIFEPFYTKKVMGRSGTGLGLAVVWNTVKDHGAFIQVESNNSGTTFTLYFAPCHNKAPVKETVPERSTFEGSGTILVVDDEDQQRDIASRILTLLGYTVESVASGEEAVARCQLAAFDLILLDMLMDPGINGLETYKQIIQFSPSQKAIIASGFSESSHVGNAKTLGVGAFIKKPYSIEQLGLAVKNELSG